MEQSVYSYKNYHDGKTKAETIKKNKLRRKTEKGDN